MPSQSRAASYRSFLSGVLAGSATSDEFGGQAGGSAHEFAVISAKQKKAVMDYRRREGVTAAEEVPGARPAATPVPRPRGRAPGECVAGGWDAGAAGADAASFEPLRHESPLQPPRHRLDVLRQS